MHSRNEVMINVLVDSHKWQSAQLCVIFHIQLISKFTYKHLFTELFRKDFSLRTNTVDSP